MACMGRCFATVPILVQRCTSVPMPAIWFRFMACSIHTRKVADEEQAMKLDRKFISVSVEKGMGVAINPRPFCFNC